MEFTTRQIGDGFWAIQQDGVRSFLFVGADSAILVDTCFSGDIKSVCDTITDKPVTLITTHSDGDHIGCDRQFPVQYLHPCEFDYYERRNHTRTHARPMWEGDIFDIGAFRFEVILTPGHTPGSIVLLEREKHFIVSGDTVQQGYIYMFGDGRNVSAFLHSMQKLDKMRLNGDFDSVYAAHDTTRLPADVITDQLSLAEAILNGTAVPTGDAPAHMPDHVKLYEYGRVRFYH